MWRRLPTYFPNLRLQMLPLTAEQKALLGDTGWLREVAFRCEPKTTKVCVPRSASWALRSTTACLFVHGCAHRGVLWMLSCKQRQQQQRSEQHNRCKNPSQCFDKSACGRGLSPLQAAASVALQPTLFGHPALGSLPPAVSSATFQFEFAFLDAAHGRPALPRSQSCSSPHPHPTPPPPCPPPACLAPQLEISAFPASWVGWVRVGGGGWGCP
jgi:hypothetical protein